MITKYDIGDEVKIELICRVVSYCAEKDVDCFKVKVVNKVDDQSQGTYLFLSSRDLDAMNSSLHTKEDSEESAPIIDIRAYAAAKRNEVDEDDEEV